MDKIAGILSENGYPEYIRRFLHKFLTAKDEWKMGPEKCPIYIKIPWKGKMSQRYEEQIKRCVSDTYLAVRPRVIFTSRRPIPAVQKDVLPASKLRNIIYEFECRCDARYVGRTTQTLTDRIKQHVPLSIRKNTIGTRIQPVRACRKVPASIPTSCASAIGQHLIENANCAEHYNVDAFKILSRGRSTTHLRILEATFIYSTDPM